jgi:hypothetical protein
MAHSDRIEAEAAAVDPSAEAAPFRNQQGVAEDQLESIIAAARTVAIVAEELLRDITQRSGDAGPAPHALAMAPRLLAATEQQLLSVAAMLRQY